MCSRAASRWPTIRAEDFNWVVIADYLTQNDSNGLANWPDPTCCVNFGILLGGHRAGQPARSDP